MLRARPKEEELVAACARLQRELFQAADRLLPANHNQAWMRRTEFVAARDAIQLFKATWWPDDGDDESA